MAALAVVLYHYTSRAYGEDNLSPIPYERLRQVTQYGYLGVQLFFIISGYVVLLSVQGKTVRQFFVSRVQRLYPAFWVAATLTFLVVRIWGTGPDDSLSAPLLHAGIGQYLLNMTMLHEFLGYGSIDQAYWTLTVEISFYFIISLLVAYKLMPHLNLVIGLWLAYAVVAPSLQDTGEFFSHLLFPQHAPFFIAGMLFYLLQKPTGRTRLRYCLLLLTYAVAVRYSWLAMANPLRSDASVSVVMAIITAFFLLMGLVAFGQINFSRQAWLAKLGALTYPLYLLHGHIGYVAFHRIGYLFTNKYVLLASLLAVMLLASYLVYIWVEKPLSRVVGTQLTRLLTYLTQAAQKNPAQTSSSEKYSEALGRPLRR